ncbi:MAG: hypothetical protein UH239_00535 [Acutalibacteraceae bacterium]|nr:hypothetical protein [Acutalibacteraceae bacterium]
MLILLALLLVAFGVVIIARNTSNDYNAGSGMFKNSEFNIEEKNKDFSDVEYYGKSNKMK